MFLNMALATDDLFILNEFQNVNFPLNNGFTIIGNENRCKIFSYLFHKHYNIPKTYYIVNQAEISKLNIFEALLISQKTNII